MAEKKLTKEHGRRLVGLLHEQERQAYDLGETVERNRFAAAAAALGRWLDDGGPYPPVAAEFAHLLDGAAEAAEPPAVEQSATTRIADDEPWTAEEPVAAEPPAVEDSAATQTADDGLRTTEEPVAAEPPGVEDSAATRIAEDRPRTTEAPVPAERPVVEESFEARSARQELERIRAEFEGLADDDAGGLNRARARIESLRSRPERPADTEILAGEIQTRINRLIDAAHERGRQHQEAGRLDDARREYDFILKLDKDDTGAAAILDRLDREHIETQAGRAGHARLAQGLKERSDIRALEAAVREAELLQIEKRLPPDLATATEEARRIFDKMRLDQGAMTTMARLGDLTARRQAVRDLEYQQVNEGRTTVFDATRNEYVPTLRAIEEARIYYQEQSDDLATYELLIVDRAEPGHPVAALELLRQLMATEEGKKDEYVRGFTPETVKKWFEPREKDLTDLVEKFRLAEEKVAAAEESADPLKRIGLLREAQGLYPRLNLLDERIGQARAAAINLLAREAGEFHNLARDLIADGFYPRPDNVPQETWYQAFGDARDALREADKVLARWTDGERPPELEALVKASEGDGVDKGLRGEIKAAEAMRREFDHRAGQIRAGMLSPDERQTALLLYNETDKSIMTDPRYAPLRSELERLRIFVSQYKGIGDQLADARRYAQDGNWAETARLAREIRDSGKAGDATAEVKTLLTQAERENDIADIQSVVAAQRYEAAQKRLTPLLAAAAGEEKAALEERLKEPIAAIQAAAADTTMAPLYGEAVRLAKGSKLSERLAALRLLRHVGGDQGQTPDHDWPAFVPSFQTYDAQVEAKKLRDELLQEHLATIQAAALSVREGAKIDDRQVAAAADVARLLRGAALLDSEERRAADVLVLHQGRIDARNHESEGRWPQAVAIWERLDLDFPRDVKAELRRARIRKLAGEADNAIHAGRADDALARLRDPSVAETIGEAWELLLKEADALAALDDYAGAEGIARRVAARSGDDPDQAQIVTAAEAKLRWLQREQSIVRALGKANDERDKQRYREAVATLDNARRDGLASDSRRLKDLTDTIVREATEHLIGEAERYQGGNSQESKTQAIILLAELDEIEKLANVPQEQRQADGKLRPLKNDLPPSIESTLDEVYNFRPAADSLDNSIARATELSSRLQSFRRVADVLNVELGTLRPQLDSEGPEMGKMVDRLRKLRERLDKVGDAKPDAANPRAIWDEAVESGNFDQLDIIRTKVDETGLADSPDARAFQQRLEEWKAIRAHVADKIGDIIQSFTVGAIYAGQDGSAAEAVEDFPGALRRLRELAQMPPLRTDRHAPWQQLKREDYERVLRIMGPLLIISHVPSGDVLIGWKQVEEKAQSRLEEVNAWTNWEYTFTEKVNQAGMLIHTAQTLLPGATRVEQRDAWKAADAALAGALAVLDAPVTLKDGTEVAVQTRWAELIYQRAVDARRRSDEWQRYAQGMVAGTANLRFPSPAEFSAAAQNGYDALAALLARAREIGASNEDESRQLVHYQNQVLPRLGGTPRRSLRDRLQRRG